MIAQLDRRVEELERQNRPDPQDPAEAAEERFRRCASVSLSDGELQAMLEYAKLWQDDPAAQPNPEQKAAIKSCELRLSLS